VLLTDAGQTCLPGLSEAFGRMAAVLERLRAQDCGGPLTVSTSPAFAAKWLVPRLERLQERCPKIDVRVSAAMRLADFAREDVDAAIRYESGRYPGLLAELLLTNEVVPVCAPALLEGPRPSKGAAGPQPPHAAAR
jgi:LysR family glycine cleavage system transcriptional activator